ncbi:STAS domain-containing protein [Streptomyces sp. NRRL B-3648]|uniref:STAS domain-containing protein n=1 Tax=Streptomyces sp. NRRL B-3648 TaxID=1519493 RepID=UPI0006B024E7|nr:STAS domain-containing protein [Streptomyces sp. NRRL B-3648]KOV93053.1 anti-anti-sigma factor BldG [Streptomyces sp. NRRL B-3648]
MTQVTEAFDMTVQHTGDSSAVLAVAGDVDLHTAPTLRDRALAVVEEGAAHVVLDMAQVGFVDSTGLSALITLMQAAHGAGGSLRLAEVPDRLSRMISITGISQLMPVHATVADALAGQATDGQPDRAGGRTGVPD